ncbi:MAG: efflux RND transporter permease subunit [Candidatus Schekmanbacteria bacterium]|nr:efflux RND transporter permease subunit [Candidatus Schekmanbacteria bacterium]
MNLPKLAVHRPVTTTMMLISIIVIGAIALTRLPLAYLPELDVPFIGIEISYPSSNPTQIEKLITKPVEEALATLSGVKKLASTSTADSAEFQLEFRWGESLDLVRLQVSEKMDLVRPTLPSGIGEIMIYSFNTTDIPVVQGRISAKGVDLSKSYDLIEARVLNPLRRVPGVARVDLNGIAPREIDIDLVLDKIKEHAVDVDALIRRLQSASDKLVLGQADSGNLRYTVRAVGAFASVEEIGAMVVDERGLRLSDIAEITYEEPPVRFGRHLDRHYAVAIEVYKESTANTVEVVRRVLKVIREDIGADPLLKGVELFVWEDQAEEITAGIDGLKSSGAVGALLAVLVLYFFLRRLDSTLIVSLSIPFSVVAACGVLYFMGKSLNILSMMGLMLGVGMLVDNAIVVLEAIDRRHRDVRDTKAAALSGAIQVTLAVTASTATSLIVFLPLIVGASSDLTTWLREVGIAISLALGCSLLSSLTLIPLMSAHFLRERKAKPIPIMTWVEGRYTRILAWTLRHKVASFFIVIAGLGTGVVPFAVGWVESGMFSAVVNERLFLRYEFKDFSYKADSEKAVTQVESYLYENQKKFGIKTVYSYYAENDAGSAVVLDRKDLSDKEIKELRKQIRDGMPQIPGVRAFFHEDTEQGGSSTYFAVKFFGQDSQVLMGLATEAERRLDTVDGVHDISTPFNKGAQEVQVTIDRAKALRMGFTAQDLADIFAFTLGGMRLRRFNTGSREVETWLALRLEDRTNLEDVKRIHFTTPDGGVLRLGDIASFTVIRRENEISRENRKVQLALRATYDGEKWDDAKKAIEGLMNGLVMPTGYSWSWNDRILEQEDQNQQMLVNMVLALALVYLVMASLFESLAQPFAILFSIPFALPGVSWLLAATGTPFNLMAQIGLLILMGTVVNNGIVLLDHINQLRREGMPRDEAIVMGGRDRLRAILMTAATTVFGLAPLAIGGANVSGLLYFPMARTVMGGLISSVFLTLVVLPYVMVLVEGVANWAGDVWRSARSGATVPVPAAVADPETGQGVAGGEPAPAA